MDRTDFVKNRIDVIRNVYTLYSYAKSDNIEDKNWAIQRFKQGHWYVVEPFGDLLLFAPSRFVGYKDNTRAKHMENPGDGTHTNSKFYELKLYKEVQNDFLVQKFQSFMKGLGIEKNTAKFFIPYDLDVSDLKCHHKCYFVSPTHCEGQKEIAWKDFLTKGIIAIGWKDIDYSNKSIEDIMQEYKGDADALSAFPLIKQIKSGDIICCTHNKHGLWGIGIATSSYKYEKGIHYAGVDDHDVEWNYSHYIEVAWLCYNKSGFIPTSNLHIQPSEKQWNPYGTLSQKEIPQYINRYIFKDTDIMDSKKQYADFIDLLKNNKNLILTGAPGTGKTFLAREIANAMGAEVEFVQFHPSYDYTDFVEGLRPTPPDQNGNIGFERNDGIFKEFCKKALKNRSSKFVFIIDEINRGEISKIFGELFFAIDPGYRGESGKVKTQYNNLINNDESDEDDEFEDGFFVPENVYVIGTMNDIDRSVESMDFAMRRRFAWKEVNAKETQYMLNTMFDNNNEITEKDKQLFIDEAKKRMNNLNKAIEQIESFNSSYHIGASYFLKLKNYYKSSSDDKKIAFNSLWENHLKGLLYEYLRGMPDAENKLEELKNAYNSGYASNTQTPNNQQSSIDTEKVNDGE